jgi:hypothetical protein
MSLATCSTRSGSDVHRHASHGAKASGRELLAPPRRQSRHRASPRLSRACCGKRPENEGSPASSYLDGPQGLPNRMKERLPNSSPAPEPGKPSLDAIAQLHATISRQSMGYLRGPDAGLRRGAAQMLAVLRRRRRQRGAA